MAQFKVRLTDENDRVVYDKIIEAESAIEAFQRAAIDKDDMERSSTLGMGVVGKMQLGRKYEPKPFVINPQTPQAENDSATS